MFNTSAIFIFFVGVHKTLKEDWTHVFLLPLPLPPLPPPTPYTHKYTRHSTPSSVVFVFYWPFHSKSVPLLQCFIASGPRWHSWMRRPTGDQEVAGSTPAEVGNILSWRLIMKYFLRSFSPFRWFKKGSCQFLAKEWAQYWLTA